MVGEIVCFGEGFVCIVMVVGIAGCMLGVVMDPGEVS